MFAIESQFTTFVKPGDIIRLTYNNEVEFYILVELSEDSYVLINRDTGLRWSLPTSAVYLLETLNAKLSHVGVWEKVEEDSLPN